MKAMGGQGQGSPLGRPEGRRLALATLGARLPQGMIGISLLLLLAREQGIRAAGGVAACYTLGFGMIVPLSGRLIDRVGVRRVVPVMTLAHTVSVLSLIAAAAQSGYTILCLICAALAGVTGPPLGPAVRALWLQSPEMRRAGLALDTAFLSLSNILGPVTASALVAVHPSAGLLGVLLLTMTGGYFLLSVPERSPGPDARHGTGGLWGPLHVSAFRRLLTVMLFASSAITSVAVGLPALAEINGAGQVSGLLVGAFSVGGVIGGIAWGRRGPRHSRPHRLSMPLIGLAAAFSLLPLAGDHLAVLLAVAPLAGLPVAIVLAALAMAAADSAPAGTATEAQSWLVTANTAGSAAAAVVVTDLLARGEPRTALIVPTVLALMAAGAALLVRDGGENRAGTGSAVRVPGRDGGVAAAQMVTRSAGRGRVDRRLPRSNLRRGRRSRSEDI